MARTPHRLAVVAVAVFAVAGLGVAGPTGGVAGSPNATGEKPGTNAHVSENQPSVGIDVECERQRVAVTAPEDHQYDVSVTVANVTPTASDVSQSTLGSVEGNATVDVDGEGFVVTLVRGQDGSEVSDVTDCTAGEQGTTTRDDDAIPGIDVDCDDGVVRFTAPEEREYTAKVTAVTATSTGTSTSGTTQTLDGNATVAVDDGALVAAFASTGDLGDDRTVSAIRNCPVAATGDNPAGDAELG